MFILTAVIHGLIVFAVIMALIIIITIIKYIKSLKGSKFNTINSDKEATKWTHNNNYLT